MVLTADVSPVAVVLTYTLAVALGDVASPQFPVAFYHYGDDADGNQSPNQ